MVLDTNVALDLLLFDDPAVAHLRTALHSGRARWLATPAMREELARVLGYPALVKALARRQQCAGQVLTAFDAWVCTVAAAPPAPVRCADPDDQIFIDLALAHGAVLLSKDREVRRALRSLGKKEWGTASAP